MLFRMLLMWKALSFSFNKKITPLFTIVGFLILYFVNSIGFALDQMFFPVIRKKNILKPIVIVGNPRSGTTFMQRFLAEMGLGAGMRIWKMLYPSLSIQALMKPFVPLMEKLSPARHHSSVIHKTSLTDIEADDPALFFRYFDGFFAYAFLLAWAQEDLRYMFDPDNRDTSERDFSYLRKIWIRNLVGERQERVISKLFSISIRIPQFLREFPDAKILFMIRDPLQTVPSSLSLVTSVLDNRFGFWSLSEAKRGLYVYRLYDGLLELSLSFLKDYESGAIPKQNMKIIRYDRMINDFRILMEEIFEFVEEPVSEDLINAINKTAKEQRTYASKHKYDLAKFGLSEDKIRNDYAPIYDSFLVS